MSAGRCYCGRHEIQLSERPITVVHCHCADCRRVTGAAFATFAAFDKASVRITPDLEETSHVSGVARRFCPACGSAMTARFDYLKGQVYVPIGILTDAEVFTPTRHCHASSMLSWLQIDDDLPRDMGSAQQALAGSSK